MPQVGQAPLQSTEYMRTVYRALGVSEETLTRAIQFTEALSAAPSMPKLPKIKRRRGQAEGTVQPKRSTPLRKPAAATT